MIEFRVLGPFEVVEGDQPLAVGSPRQRALLVLLVLHRGESVSSERLVDELWGEHPPASAIKIVQGYVSGLRRVLGDEILQTRGRGYALQAGPGQTDAERFEALVAEGRRALEGDGPRAAVARLSQALDLWRGPALSDFADWEFAQVEITRLEEARLSVVEDRIEAELALGRHAELVSDLEAMVRRHPLRERLVGQLLLALYRSGRQADALEAYQVARRRLLDDLGLVPGRDLQDLERAILAQDPKLDPPRRPDRMLRPRRSRRPRSRRELVSTAGGVLLLAALVAVTVALTGSSGHTVVAAPNSLAVIDPSSNRVVAVVGVGARPGPIAFGSGSVWTANLDDQTISRVDPRRVSLLRTIALRAPPAAIASADNGLWVVESAVDPEASTASSITVARIDPEFDSALPGTRIGNVVPDAPGAIAARGSSVWVAPSSGLLTRLAAATGKVTEQRDPNASPAGIALTGDGAVWLTDSDADDVVRVDPTGLRTVIPVGNAPMSIVAGAGAIWVVDSLDDAVVRIDPSSRSVTNTIHVGDSPAGIAVGAGAVWVANAGSGTVTRIDPLTDRVGATIHVGGSPTGVTVADGRVWVSVDSRSINLKGTDARGGTLRLVSGFDLDSTDPALAYEGISWQLEYATCAKLLNYPDRAGAAGSELVPEVAAALPSRSRNGKTYTFTIRPGFRFSPPSDQMVTAETFKYTIERTLNHRTQSPMAQILSDVVGAPRFIAGRAAHISGVVARGNKLVIRLRVPEPDFPSRIAMPAFCAVPTDTPINPSGERAVPSAGPYYIASYAPGQGALLLRNPNYHGRRPHRFARIELAVGVPARRAISEIETGAADYTTLDGEHFDINSALAGTAASLARRLGKGSPAAAQGRQQFFVSPAPSIDYFVLNTHRRLFSNVKVRQAVNYAIDRRALAAIGAGGHVALPDRPISHYLPPGIPGYRAAMIYPLPPT